jgi:hypothetical protein
MSTKQTLKTTLSDGPEAARGILVSTVQRVVELPPTEFSSDRAAFYLLSLSAPLLPRHHNKTMKLKLSFSLEQMSSGSTE